MTLRRKTSLWPILGRLQETTFVLSTDCFIVSFKQEFCCTGCYGDVVAWLLQENEVRGVDIFTPPRGTNKTLGAKAEEKDSILGKGDKEIDRWKEMLLEASHLCCAGLDT